MACLTTTSRPQVSLYVPSAQRAGSEDFLSKKVLEKLKSPSMASTEDLYHFSKIPLGDFEGLLAFVERHSMLDYRAAAEKMLWQTMKTFEKLIKKDLEARHVPLVQEFANQCVQQYALLDYGADCGYEKLRQYLHNLVLTSEWYRADYLTRMMNLPPPERKEFIRRPVPGHLDKLRWFCMLFDHLYEQIEVRTRCKVEETTLERLGKKFSDGVETVQSRFRGAMATSPITFANQQSPIEMDIGRAI